MRTTKTMLFLLLLFFLPGSATTEAGGVERVAFERVTQPSGGRYPTAGDAVIADAETFAQIWTSIFPDRDVPSVDFANKMVVFVSLGETFAPGANIQVTDAVVMRVANGSGPLLRVRVRETRPRATCIGTGERTAPFDMIVGDRYPEVTFRRTSRFPRCGGA